MSSRPARPNRTRTKWHWLIGGAIGAVLAVVASVALWSLADDSEGDRTEVLWLFGFSTVRVDPGGDDEPLQLDEARGFGAVVGGEGAVYMYDAPSGRVGRLDATTNRLRERDPLDGWQAGDQDGLVAASGNRVWLVTGPGELSRLDGESLDVIGTTDVGGDAARAWIAAGDGSLFVAVEDGATLDLARLDDDGTVAARVPVGDLEPLGAVQTVRASAELVWIVGERGARAFTTDALAVQGDVALSADAGTIRASLAAGRDLWLVAQNGGVAYRITLDGEASQIPLLPAPPATFQGQVDLAAGNDEVYALVPTGTATDDRSAIVQRIDTDATEVVDSLRAPSELFVGAIATTD